MNINIEKKFVRTVITSAIAAAAIGAAYGGVPLNNLQGAGGIALSLIHI